jgi:hypothetical protein
VRVKIDYGGRWQQIGNRKFLNRGVECVGNLVEPGVEEVAVAVQGHRRALVSEHLLHNFDVGAGGDRKAGRGVSKPVRHKPLEADLCNGRVEDVAPHIE